jgi:hypothetical protein
MSMHCNDPLWIPSPWPEDISDATAKTLCNTLHALAIACEDRYYNELERYRDKHRAALYDPDRPWMRKPAEPTCTDEETWAAYFKARQLDLFDSSAGWEDTLWEDDF